MRFFKTSLYICTRNEKQQSTYYLFEEVQHDALHDESIV